MRFTRITSALMAAFIGFSSVAASAQSMHEDRHSQGQHPQQSREGGHRGQSQNGHAQQGAQRHEQRAPQGNQRHDAHQQGQQRFSQDRQDKGGHPHGNQRGNRHEQPQRSSMGPAPGYSRGGQDVYQVRRGPAGDNRPMVYVVDNSGRGQHHSYYQGDRLPPPPSGYVVVNDWRDHRLDPPPRGQQWVRIGSDFVLIAVATGIIAQIILGPGR